MVQTMHEIRVAGAVPKEDLLDMGAVTIELSYVHTILYGIPDQAALYGLLARVRAPGLDVVEVRRVCDLATETSESGGGDGTTSDV